MPVILDLRYLASRLALAAIIGPRAGCSVRKASRWIEAGDLMAGGWIGSRLLAEGMRVGAWKREEGSGRVRRADSIEVACDVVDTIAALLDGFTPAQRHRARCSMRYEREIDAAYRRNMPDTAARIEAERAEWLAGGDAEQEHQ